MIGLLLLSLFTFVELNCENLFDTRHDSLRHDEEFLPASALRWTPQRYWRKLNHIGKAILSCGELDSGMMVPDMVVLTEVENDSVMHDLTRRSLLRGAGYSYVMTSGPDIRGIDVALMFSPYAFRLINSHAIRVVPPAGFSPTRDILYASGELIGGDTLHVFALHAPSRRGGEAATRIYRMQVAQRMAEAVDSVRHCNQHPLILIAGDFNDYTGDASLQFLETHGVREVSAQASGRHGAMGTYRYHGVWASLDHVLCNAALTAHLHSCYVNDMPFLLVDDEKFGGKKPRRNYLGPKYLNGYSDHLPLVTIFSF
ncbi:MAG: endonuclease [Prevotellaceae bacterium]|nr:endonuclease [Prevotellaceae bacterium]